MAGAELVVLALAAPQEPRQPARLPQRGKPIVPTGEDFPWIALMTHVPDDLVARRFERGAERDGQLDDPQTRADVPARLRHDVNQTLADFVRERLQLLRCQRANVRRTVNRFEDQLGLVTM